MKFYLKGFLLLFFAVLWVFLNSWIFYHLMKSIYLKYAYIVVFTPLNSGCFPSCKVNYPKNTHNYELRQGYTFPVPDALTQSSVEKYFSPSSPFCFDKYVNLQVIWRYFTNLSSASLLYYYCFLKCGGLVSF